MRGRYAGLHELPKSSYEVNYGLRCIVTCSSHVLQNAFQTCSTPSNKQSSPIWNCAQEFARSRVSVSLHAGVILSRGPRRLQSRKFAAPSHRDAVSTRRSALPFMSPPSIGEVGCSLTNSASPDRVFILRSGDRSGAVSTDLCCFQHKAIVYSVSLVHSPALCNIPIWIFHLTLSVGIIY